MKSFFLSNVKRGERRGEEIKYHLNKNNIREVDIQQTNHEDARCASFKVTIYKHDIHKVFSRDFWPQRIECKMWREPKSRDNEDGGSFGNFDYSLDY